MNGVILNAGQNVIVIKSIAHTPQTGNLLSHFTNA